MSPPRQEGLAPEAADQSLARFLLALLPPVVGFLVLLLFGPLFGHSVWFVFYPAVFVSAWIGGLGAGVVAAAISAGGALYFFLPPRGSFMVPAGDYVATGVFFMTAVLFGVFQGRLRASNRRSVSALSAAQHANDRLREASEAMSTLREQAPDGIFVVSAEGRITDVNGAACRMLGYQLDEILGRDLADVVPRSEIGSLERDGGRQGQLAEWTLRRKDGTELPVEVSARILSDGRWQGFLRDVRVRRRLEEALRASHDDLVRAQSVAGVGSWRLDIRKDELEWSKESYRIFGVPPGEPVTYEAFIERVHPQDRAMVDEHWQAAVRGEPYDIEHRVVTDDGEVKWVREKAELQFDEHHVLVGGIGITHDITARKQYEEELRAAQERVELALRGADLGAWDWNIESGDVVLSARWAEMRGYRPDEIRGHVDTWLSGIHPDDLPTVQRVLDDYLSGRTAEYEVEHRSRTKSGDWILGARLGEGLRPGRAWTARPHGGDRARHHGPKAERAGAQLAGGGGRPLRNHARPRRDPRDDRAALGARSGRLLHHRRRRQRPAVATDREP